MINFIFTAIKIIFLLGFLVFIHEGGHFLVAKLCKVKVLEFAIGFGPTIWKKQGKETKYALRLIPLGGFVNLEGEEERSDEEGSFSQASIPKRMAIIVAGATVNIIFGLLVFFILMTSTGNNISLVVDDTIDGYAAKASGIIQNDEIIKINDKKVNVKNDVDKILSSSHGEELLLTIKRNGEEQTVKLIPTKIENKSTGIYLKSSSDQASTKIVAVEKGSSSESAGIKANDRILKINGIEVSDGSQILSTIQKERNSESILFTIQRGNEIIEINVIPDTIYTYYLGVTFKMAENNLGNNMYYAIFKTRDFLFSIGDNLKQLFTGNIGVDQMMGPVGISEAVAQTQNFSEFIYLMALISLSLGITNLLPFPALDGGKFVLLILEAIRGKKLKEQTEINIQLIGFTILIILAIYVTYNDILRIF